MLQTFYNNFGFFGSIFISFTGFMFFIFWMSGIAGILEYSKPSNRIYKLILAVLIPPYPIGWLIWDIYHQRKMMQEEQ